MTVPPEPLLFRRIKEPPLSCHITPREALMIITAYIFAKHGHRWQTRKQGGRYIEHPQGVVWILIDELGVVDAICIAAGLLHDCPEDTRDITVELIEFGCDTEVARTVLQVSKLPKEGYYERLLVYGEFRALLVKMADRIHNLRSMEGTDLAFMVKQYRQTSEEFLPLVDRLRRIAPAMYAEAAAKAAALVEKELAALEARIAATPA